mgnify:FL=1
MVSMPPCHGGGGVRIPRIPQICSKIRVTSLVNHRFESDTKLQKLLSIILFSNFSDYVPVALVGRKVLAVNQTLKKPPWVRILPGTQNLLNL